MNEKIIPQSETTDKKLLNEPQNLISKTSNKSNNIIEINLWNFKFIDVKKIAWKSFIFLKIEELKNLKNINISITNLLDYICEKNFYIKWFSQIKVKNYRLIDLLYKFNLNWNVLWEKDILIWEIVMQDENIFMPNVKKNKNTEYCELEFKHSINYDLDSIIFNLWNWWWSKKNETKLWYNYTSIILSIKFCRWEINKEDFLKLLAKHCFSNIKFKTIQDIEKYLKDCGFLKFIWQNISIKIAQNLEPQNWDDSKLEIKSKKVILDTSPKDKNSDRKIDMYEYWNVTFNVWKWEVLFTKIPSTKWKNWLSLNWDVIRATDWIDKINLEKIIWENIEIVKNEDNNLISLVSKIDGFLIWYDPKKPNNKIYVDNKKELKWWINMKTWSIDDLVLDWYRKINWAIEKDYSFKWKKLEIIWDIENNVSILLESYDNWEVEADIKWTIYSANIFCNSKWKISINKLWIKCFIYSPLADIEVNEVWFWAIIIANSIKIKKWTNIDTLISNETKINELIVWNKTSTILSKNSLINILNWDKSSQLELFVFYEKIKKLNINLIKEKITELELKKNNIISKNKSLKLLNYIEILENLKKIENPDEQKLLTIKKLEDLLKKENINATRIDELKFMSRSAQLIVDEIKYEISTLVNMIEEYQKIINDVKTVDIKKSSLEIHLKLWQIQRDILKYFIDKKILIPDLTFARSYKENIWKIIEELKANIRNEKDEDFSKINKAQSSNYSIKI